MGYKSKQRYKQMQDAKLYGGYAGAYTNDKGQSWLQQQVEQDPDFVKNSDQSTWGRDAYYHWKDQAAGKQGQQQGPNVNAMPMPNVPISPQVQQQAIQYATNPENGLVIKQKYQTVWLNGDPNQGADAFAKLAAGGNSQPFEFASMDQVLKGQAAWTDASVDERKKMLSDPNFYKNNEILKLDPALQQELFKDPSFDWKQLPAWQKTYFDLSSSPAGMGAAQGALMGLGGGPVGSAVGSAAGAVLGWAGGVSEYDQNKEAWQQGDGKFTWDTQQLKDIAKGAFGWMNFAAEQAEKAIGIGVQAIGAAQDPNVDLKDVFTPEGWNAGAGTFEAVAPAMKETGWWESGKNLLEKIDAGESLTVRDIVRFLPIVAGVDMFLNPDQYKGEELYLGAAVPVELTQTFQEKLKESRERIAKGEDYRVVMTEMQTGVIAQMGDMIGQAVADPLNVMGKVEATAGEGIAKITGNSVAAEAFKGADGLTEAAAKYKTLVQTGEAVKINPDFKVENMSGISRWAAGLTADGKIKAGGLTNAGLLDQVKGEGEARPSLFKDPKGFVKMLTSETPQSRAETGAVMFKDNVVAMLSMFDDPHEAIKYIRALSNNDMDTWSQLGGRFAESPEFYTVLPALKDFNGGKLEGIIQAWDMTSVNRDYLTKVADVLGDSPARVLDDLAKRGTSEQDFTRIVERLKASTDPNAKAMLADIDAGKFTVDTLAQVVDVFTGDGALPYHPAQWKAMMGAELSDHFGNWAADRLALDKSPEAKSAFFRTMGVLKTAQSILLLGGSPGYAIQNGLSGMVHLAASGIYGFMSPKQIGNFLDRLGVSPARMDEGVGIGGMVDPSTSLRSAQDAISKATKGTGTLTEVKQTMGKISSGMPMSKLSSWFEKLNGKQAFAQGMKQMWSQSWRRGVGFSNMRPELVNTIKQMGIDPKHIYAAIEAGMNQAEIEKALFGRFEGVQARSLVHDAAARSGMSASEAAAMLEKLGVLDQLDSYLKGQTTPDGIRAAFEKAAQTARDQVDIRTGEDLARIADGVMQRVGLEGAASGLDVVQKAHSTFTDTWMDHYFRFGDVFESLQDISDDAMKSKAIELAYKQSDDEFRRMYARNAANYKGIFDAWGLSGDPKALKVLQAIGEADAAMKTAYDFMRAARREHFSADWGGDIDAMFSNWDKINGQINAAFNQAFKDKHTADVKMGAGLAEIYEGLYGKAAGEAARLWWEDTVKLNDEIVAKERKARNEFARLPKEQRAIAKKKYYGETKIMQIAELEKVNQAGIARLERVIKGGGGSQNVEGGGQGGPVSPVDDAPSADPSAALRSAQDVANVGESPSTAPQSARGSAQDAAAQDAVTPAQEIADLTAKAEARVEVEQVEQAAKVESIWGVAAEYVDRNGAAYDPANKYPLIGALRKAEYGGDATLLGLDDPKVTPEFVRDVLEKRKAVMDAQQAQAAAVVQADIVVKPRSELDPRLSEILNMEAKRIADVISGGEAGKRLFDESGFIGATASTYPDWYGDLQKQTGGKQKLLAALDKIQKDHGADKGVVVERVKEFLASTLKYGDPETGSPPNLVALKLMGADDVMMADALNVFNDQFQTAFTMEQVLAESFDWDSPSTALRSAQDAIAQDVFDVQEWEGKVFKALQDEDLTALYDLEGELPRDLLGERNSPEGETYGDFINRTMMTVEDANRIRYRDEGVALAKAQADEALYQQGVKSDAVMTRKLLEEKFVESFGDDPKVQAYMAVFDAVVGTFARATGESVDSFTARFYADVMRSAEDGPSAALRSAQDALAQDVGTAKGAVVFDPETMKATIHAFESADMSTLIHENAHVFRRMFADVAERTGNATIKADLATIEDWAGVKDGAWDVAAEEKFARGFERYLADGYAPTPALAGAFRTFRNWMLDIYKSITGSSIDVKLSPDVRDAFSRMMGAEKAGASTDILKTLGDEYFGEQVDTFSTMSFRNLRELGKRQGELGTKITQYMDEIKTVISTLRDEELYVAATPLGGNNRFDSFTSYAMDEMKARGLSLDVSNVVDVSKVSEVDPELVRRVAKIEDDIARRVFGESVDLFKDIGYASGKASGKITEYEIALRAEMKGWSEAELQAAAKTNVIREANMTTLQYTAWTELNSRRPSSDGSPSTAPSTALRSAQDVADVDAGPVLSNSDAFYVRRRTEYVHWKSENRYTGTAYERARVSAGLGVDRNGVTLKVGDRITVDGRNDIFAGVNSRGEVLTNWGVFNADQVLSVTEIVAKVEAQQDTGTAGGMLPGMQAAMSAGEQGYLFGTQEVGKIKKMDASGARSLYDVAPTRTAADGKGVTLGVNDIVLDESGRRYSVAGANMRGKVVTQDGKILEPGNVTRVAKQEGLFDVIRKDYAMIPKDLSVFVDDVKRDIYAKHRMDVQIDGAILEGYHPVTGNKMITINFENGEIIAKSDKYQSQAADIKALVEELIFKKKAGMELANLKNYPGRNAESIQVFNSLLGEQDTNSLFQRAEAVDTPAFKNWFGDSKVVDEGGRPLVVYHGTGADFTEFNTTKEGQFGKGAYFSNQPSYASGFAKFGKEPNVIPVYLSIRNPFVIETVLDIPSVSKLKKKGFDGIIRKEIGADGVEYIEYVAWSPEQIKSTANRGTFDPNNPNILYQQGEGAGGAGTSPAPTDAVNFGGEQPFGALDAAAGDQALFHGEVMDEGWRTQVQPLLDAMKEGALEQAQMRSPSTALRSAQDAGFAGDMSPEGQKMLRQYMKQVQSEMATSKLATMKWGEHKRDEALLNYGKRYGIDRYAEVVYPYQYFYTRSLGAWAARAIDKPAWFANYARIKKQQDRYENNLPERLRGKIKISMPWMPDWMGDALYIDPLANLFTPANYLKPFERMQKDSTMQQQEAERILQEWAADGRMSQSELQAAAQNRSGAVWERALAEAGIRRESEIANPMDFLNTMFGPAWYLTTPYKLLQGEGKSVTSTPLLNTTRAIDTVTQGTWAEGAGNVIGMLGKPEEWMRKKLGLPEFGEYGDYYIDRQLSNMAAEGVLSPEDAQMAMIERSGAAFEQARERVKTELAMRVPTAAALMAGLTADNFAQGIGRVATTALPSLFGAGLLPEGELEYRGLKQEWNEAWKKADGGDKTAIPEFFDEHPEYEVYLAKGKEPEERMRSFLVGQIWDGYMELGETNQKAARAQMGELFSQAFLDKETRSYESIPVEQLAAWAGLFGKKVPEVSKVSEVSNVSDAAKVPDAQLKLYDASVTQITDQYFEQRREKFPTYYQVEQGYYNIPKSERTSYLMQHPELKQYWSWKDSWNNAHPELVPIFKGQVFKTVDTSGWPDALVDYVSMYAMTGERLPSGAYKALEQQWIMEGKPYDDLDTWLNAQVVPALQYGGAQP